jgi:hypothetical protein
MFDAVELIKGHTPDKGADSLGGTVNLKTRSPLSMREKRRTTYNFRHALGAVVSSSRRRCARSTARTRSSRSRTRRCSSVFGGTRNLGVSLPTFSTAKTPSAA